MMSVTVDTMSKNNQDREKQLEELDGFIEMTYKRVNNFVSTLGWSFESVSNQIQSTAICPFDNLHRIPEKSLEDHLEKCQWKAEGYTEHELPLSEPCILGNGSSSIRFDEQLQDMVLLKARQDDPSLNTATGVGDRLIPRTSDRLMASFTSDERKAIYDYVIANTVKHDIGDDIADMNRLSQKDGNNPKISLLELLAQERNLKRRRAKHRGVHTNKKSQVEILREVINQQMEMFEEYLGGSLIKEEPKSPETSEAGDQDFQANRHYRKHDQSTTIRNYEVDWQKSSTASEKSSDRGVNIKPFYPEKKPSLRDSKKRERSRSRDGGRKKHHSKHKKERSRERSRREDSREKPRPSDKKNWSRNKEYETDETKHRRKRHRSSERSNNKHVERSKRREDSDNNYYKADGKQGTDRIKKRNQ